MHWLTKCQLIDIVVSESRASTSFKQGVGFVCAVIAMYDCVSIKQYIFCQFRFKISFKYVAKMLALFVMNTLKLKQKTHKPGYGVYGINTVTGEVVLHEG